MSKFFIFMCRKEAKEIILVHDQESTEWKGFAKMQKMLRDSVANMLATK